MLCLTLHLSVSQLRYFVTKCWIKSVPLQMLQAVLSHCMNILEINVILKKAETSSGCLVLRVMEKARVYFYLEACV